jgi:pyruvate dehydrogenase E1 component alpha subunit
MATTKERKIGIPTEHPVEAVDPKEIDLVKKMYREMLFVRRFEEASAKSYASGKITGFCHLYIGQEAVAVGALNAIEERDYILTTYRDHGHALLRGVNPGVVMAELYGRRDGCSGGKGGSMHLFDRSRNFMGGHGIVGGHLAIASGVGWAIKYRKEDRVCLCFFGEGAANIGAFHEALNLAGLWKLPVVFICENNLYSMGTPTYRASPVEDVSIRAPGYDMPRDSFYGEDALGVQRKLQPFVDRARRGEGPSLIEIKTYRFRGHSMTDPAKYRTKEEVDEYRKRDPIPRAKSSLGLGGVPEEWFAQTESEIRKIVDDAVAFAERSEAPDPASLYTNVYAD